MGLSIDEMTNLYHEQLMGDESAMAYFLSRQISEQVIARHKVGWIVEPLVSHHEDFQGLPVLPYLSATGKTILLRGSPFESDSSGRPDLLRIEESFPLHEKMLHLFNVGNAMPGLRTNRVHLVRDVESVLVVRSAGERAVAVPGWHNWHESWVHLFLHSRVMINHDETDHDFVKAIMEQFKRYRVPYSENVMSPGVTLADQIRSRDE